MKPLISKLTRIVSVLVLGLFILSSCGGGTSGDVQELDELLNAEGQTSLQMIDQAVAEKKLDGDTALLYKLYAVFGDEALPAEYQSAKKFRNSDEVVAEARSRLDSMSGEMKAKIEPFFKRPDDPESYFNLKYADQPAASESSWVPSAYAQRPDSNIYTEFLVSADGKAKVWYPNRDITARAYSGTGNIQVSASSAKQIAEQLKGFLDTDNILQREENLMGRKLVSDGTRGGDDKFDIYVAPGGSDLGLTYCEGNKPCSAYIIINANVGTSRKRVLRTTLAHEVFHAYQYAFKYREPADDWWSEATAVWAEDFIYGGDNTEQDWLHVFIEHPDTSLFDQHNPDNHHYGAYIFPYFYSENYGDDYMRQTWEGCESAGDCLKAVDQVIDGGFKKQWKEFTMWNYNKEPVKKYTDINGFKDVSSDAGGKTGQEMLTADPEDNIEIDMMNPLSAYLTDAINIADPDKVKKLKFKNLKDFTDLNESTGIKALIFYENGRKEVEDWSKLKERSFCIENKDENFSHIMLIFSNGDMKDMIGPTSIKVEGSDNCYNINQKDQRTAVIHFPYSDAGTLKIVDINTTIETDSMGEPVEKAEEGQPYAYLTKWNVRNEFEQVRDAFVVECDGSSVDFLAGWTTRAVGHLHFDLGPEGLAEDGTFSVDLEYGGEAHPNGISEEVPGAQANCISTAIGASSIDVSNMHFTMENVWQGRIYDMTEDGAKIEIFDSCLYDDCTMQTGEPFQTISEPVILEIKKGSDS